MKFVDFDVLIGLAAVERRRANLGKRAFVEAVVVDLRQAKLQAPWAKLFLAFREDETEASWMPPYPKLGLSSAGLYVPLSDPRLMSIQDETIRRVLADNVLAVRPLVRERADWDDDAFWRIVERAGAHRGPYRHRLRPATDRRSKVLYALTHEWDESGTRLFLDAFRDPDATEPLGRDLVGEYESSFEWYFGRVPSKVRLVPDGVELWDRTGLVKTVSRPPISEG
jgi:hypothetical protein